jgi:hypothetical protein
MLKLKELKILLQKYFGTSSPEPTETKKSIPAKDVAPHEKLSSLVEEIGKDMFGIRVKVEWGKCPYCEMVTQLLSLHKNYFRCSQCHETTRQYVNGHISYLPINEKSALSNEPKA